MAKKKASCSENSELVSGLLAELNKDSKTAFTFYEREDPSEVKLWLPTGSTLLDYAISNRRNGGIPFGRIIEINGLESSGKSLLSMHIIASAQRMHPQALGVVLDTEGRSLDKDFLRRFGLDTKRTLALVPQTIEDCFQAIEDTIINIRNKQKAKDVPLVIVWDSLAATPPQAEIEGSYDASSQIGIGAKAVARGLRKLTQTIGIESVSLIVINQLRMKLNAMPYTDPYITPYGKSLAYYASTRLRVNQKKTIKTADKKDTIGVGCEVKVVKNSLGPPMRNAEFPIIFGYGVDDTQSLHDFLHDEGIIKHVNHNNILTLGGVRYETPTDEWKKFMAIPERKAEVLDLLEQLLVKRYEDYDPVNDLHTVAEESAEAAGL